jgi:hypothetical protein
LNGLTASTQTFAVGTSGSDFNISSGTSTHTFNIPYAGAASTGLITTNAQTIAGTKTFSSTISGSITGNAGSATTATSAGTAGTATNAGSAGSATTATSAGTAGTATNAGFAGAATTATSAGTAGTATNAGSAGTSVTAGSATTATNAGFAGAATTATSAGTAGTATNAGSAGTSVTAGSATTATNAGFAGAATTATSAGTAGTATNAGSAGTSVTAGSAGTANNSANINVVLDTTSTIFLTGSRSNASIGATAAYVLSGVSALGNTLSATGVNVTGATTSTGTGNGALVVTGGVGIGGSLWTAAANLSSISGVTHLNGAILSGAWAGTAISAVNGGTGQNTYAIGDILYASSSTALTRLAAGTAGSVLKSNGAGTAPSWQVDATGSGGAGTVAAPSASNLVAYYPGTGASVASYNRVSINTAAASMELLAQGSLPALLVNATNGASSDSVQFKSSFGDVYWALGPTTQSLKSTNGGVLQIDASGSFTITAPAALTFYNTAETFYTALTGATNATSDLTFILPTAAGTAGSVLATAGASGQLYWSAPGTGGGGDQ